MTSSTISRTLRSESAATYSRRLYYLRRRMTSSAATTSATSSLPSEMRHWERALVEAGVEDAKDSVQYIVAHAFGLKTMATVNSSKLSLTEKQKTTIQTMIDQRRKRVPVQYVIGEWDFMDLTLKMRAPVLIPRPETEELVQKIIENLDDEPHNFLEIGCGTGAISLALLHYYRKTQAIAIDSNPVAYSLTLENARAHNELAERLKVHHLRLDEDSLSTNRLFDQQYHLIVSNPPYIKSSQIPSLQEEVRNHESREALDGGADGLDVVKLMLQLAGVALKPNGSLWLEVDSSHPGRIRQLSTNHDLEYLKTFKDFRKIKRLCWLKKRKH